jgi:predicted acyltransferase
VLVFLGTVILYNAKQGYLFTNVLSQIGLGYVFLFLLWNCKVWIQALVGVAILALYGWVFYEHPLPPRAEWRNYGITENSIKEGVILEGEKAPWSKNINFAADVDRAFLNLLPRDKEFRFHSGGYQTLNFIPSLVTMIFGLMVGELLRSDRSQRAKLLWLIVGGALAMAAGVALDQTIIPNIKRICTPTFILISGAWAVWMLTAFYVVIEMMGWRRWSMPFVVVGANSLAMYLMFQLTRHWFKSTLETHIHSKIFTGDYGPVIEATTLLAVMWLICWWMYRQKLFVRI